MALFSITPRLNFDFSFLDFLTSIKGILFKSKKETGLKKYFPDSDIYFTNHARTGLLLLLSSLDLPKNSKVGVIVYNCLTVFESISLAGYRPVFIDVTNDYKMDIIDLKKKEADLDAIIVTHLFGIPSDLSEIKAIIGDKPIIEDCAHAFLDKYKDNYVGTYGVGSVFSFGQAKFPSAGEGGVVLINDSKINNRFIQVYTNLKTDSKFNHLLDILKALIFSTLMNKFIYGTITFPLRQKVGDKVDLNKKYVFNEKTCNPGFKLVFEKRLLQIAEIKNKQLKNTLLIINYFKKDYFISPTIEDQASFLVPIQSENPKKLLRSSLARGVEFGQHFKNSILWANQYANFDGNCPNAQDLIEKTVTIPCHYNLSDNDLKRITIV